MEFIKEQQGDMENQQDFAFERFNEVLESLSSEQIAKQYNELSSSLNSFYKVLYSNKLNAEEDVFYRRNFRPDDAFSHFIGSNHYCVDDIEDMVGEHVILFKEPAIVTKVLVSELAPSKSIIRLTQHNGGISQIASTGRAFKRMASRDDTPVEAKRGTFFEINDTVIGFFLPEEAYLDSIEYVLASDIFKKSNKVNDIHHAVSLLRSEASMEALDASDKYAELQRIIKTQLTVFENTRNELSLQKDMLSSTKSSVARAKSDLTEVQAQVIELQAEVDSVNTDLDDKANELSSINGRIAEKEKEIKAFGDTYAEKSKELLELDKKVKATRKVLSDAENEKTLTTLDIDGHRKETRNQLKGYYGLTLLVFSGLVGFVTYMYHNAQSFQDLLSELTAVEASAWNILISRLPMITATTLVVGGLSTVLFFLIKHIVSLNTEKMAMLKASVLAQQITDSMECNEKMTEKEVINFTRDTKIKLITQVFTQAQSGSVELNTSVLKDLATIIKAGKN
ncbi:hypothetical protein [Vibrio maritimus]|uniref:hypothetical protein n=1 Tax=Vibrio maritimus TaxID=990268 RepID=UPI001F2D2459|nr:hypothetical protein [Vibrio maritimus]